MTNATTSTTAATTAGTAAGRSAEGLAARLGAGTARVPTPEAAAALVRRGAYLSLFSLPDPASPSTGVPLTPWTPPLFVGFDVAEALHRFEVTELPPDARCGLRVRQAYGRADAARVEMRMTPMPNNFQAGAGRTPWATVLLPVLAQRFAPLDGRFQFLDDEASGFSAVGAGRVTPTRGAQPRLAAVLEALGATGRLSGLPGVGVVSGDIAPPAGFAFNVLFRFDDPRQRLAARVPPAPLADAADPTPGTTFLPLLSEPEPGTPLAISRAEDGRHLEIRGVERLRSVSLAFAVDAPGLRTLTRPGPVIGRRSGTLVLDLAAAGAVVPAFSRGDHYSFFDAAGVPIGGFSADTVEARVVLPESGNVVLVGGFAEPYRGTGQFRHPLGTVSINGAYDLETGAHSALYMVRLTAADAVFKVLGNGLHGGEGA